MIRDLVSGAMMRSRSPSSIAMPGPERLEIMLKGGQMGPPDRFARLQDGG